MVKNNAFAEDEKYPHLNDVLPSKYQRLGVEYAYIQASRSTIYLKDGWKQTTGVEPFEIDDEVFLLLEKGEGNRRSGSFIHDVYIETDKVVEDSVV